MIPNKQAANPEGFIRMVIARIQGDTAFGATMRRADNPNLGASAWEYLVPFCDLSSAHERLAFALVGAAIAREKPEKDGSASVGYALQASCAGDDDARARESQRLRRLIACDSTTELLPVLRPVLQYLQSKGNARICYEKLLKDLLFWNERVRIQWTKDFFGQHDIAREEE